MIWDLVIDEWEFPIAHLTSQLNVIFPRSETSFPTLPIITPIVTTSKMDLEFNFGFTIGSGSIDSMERWEVGTSQAYVWKPPFTYTIFRTPEEQRYDWEMSLQKHEEDQFDYWEWRLEQFTEVSQMGYTV